MSSAAFGEPVGARLRTRDDVPASWIDGSRSGGNHDDMSDVDLAVAAEDAAIDTFLAELPALVARELDPVHMVLRGRLLHAITPDWSRLDLLTRTTSEIPGGVPGPMLAVFDRGGR